ncbi:TPA: hypothetical protein HA244_01845 [Candidatus Micrarchaeota archaeon]|nr:hypothetical protein [Candidatus Micrarchaeota archaeon]
MYFNIPVKEDTKKLLDELRDAMGTKSYDETVKKLARSKSFLILKPLEGIIKGTPAFKRDKSERTFG